MVTFEQAINIIVEAYANDEITESEYDSYINDVYDKIIEEKVGPEEKEARKITKKIIKDKNDDDELNNDNRYSFISNNIKYTPRGAKKQEIHFINDAGSEEDTKTYYKKNKDDLDDDYTYDQKNRSLNKNTEDHAIKQLINKRQIPTKQSISERIEKNKRNAEAKAKIENRLLKNGKMYHSGNDGRLLSTNFKHVANKSFDTRESVLELLEEAYNNNILDDNEIDAMLEFVNNGDYDTIKDYMEIITE